jgi:hypothetical protein
MGFKRQATQSQTALFLSSLKIMIILLYLWINVRAAAGGSPKTNPSG